MNIKKNFLFFMLGLLLTFLLPSYSHAAFTFAPLDTQGKLLNFSNPVLIAGTAVAGGAGTAAVGSKFKYANVITINGVQVDAIVSVDALVNITITKFDDPKPNPTPKNPAQKTVVAGVNNYITSFGAVVPEAAIFAPQLTAPSHTADAHADFTISFQDVSGKPVVLQNVYNNSLDDENVEYNEFGGFSSFLFASDYKTNLVQHMIASASTSGSGKINFSNSNCLGNAGLYITDSSRVQTRFPTITSLKLTMGQFANGKVPNGSGGFSTCTNTSVRYYGAIFVKDAFQESGLPPIEFTAPTVVSLTTSNTKPSVTGTIGGMVSGMTQGSALTTGETFSVTLNGTTYTTSNATPNANLTINGINWTLAVPTALAIGTYEVTAARTGGLVDQSSNELVITPLCVAPQVLNLTATACVLPAATDTVICHTGDVGDKNGDGLDDANDDPLRYYVKQIINPLVTTGHETHEHDQEAIRDGVGLKCPNDTPICTGTQVLDAATNKCVTIVTTPPTVASKTTNDKIAVPLTGTAGTSTSLVITVKNSLNATVATSTTITPSANSWTYTPPVLPAGTYNVIATGDALHGGLTDSTTGELVVSATVAPTVASKTTNDKVAVPLTGTAGTSATLVVTVKNSSNAIVATSTTITPSANSWTYTPPVLVAGTYDVVVTGDAASGGLVDTTTGELVVSATNSPTVTSMTINDQQIPTLTGTTGTSTAITISGVTCTATVTGTTWSCPLAAKLIANTYTITATGNIAGLTGTGTLTVTATTAPTVDTPKSTTNDVAVALTGTLGTSTSLTVVITNSSTNAVVETSPTITPTGTTWTYTPSVLPTGTYSVIATGDSAHGGRVSNTGTLTVTAATVPSISTISRYSTDRTYTSPTAVTTNDQTPTIKGNVGTSSTVTVTIKNLTTGAVFATSSSSTLTIFTSGSSKTWAFTPSTNLPSGTYDIVVVGNTGLTDTTQNELIINVASGFACTKLTNSSGNYYLPSALPLNHDYNIVAANKVDICNNYNSQPVLCSVSTGTSKQVTNCKDNNNNTQSLQSTDTVWQSDKNCPTQSSDCSGPTIDIKVTTDQAATTTLTGTTGSGTYLKYLKITGLNVNETASSASSNSRLTYTTSGSTKIWSYTYSGTITAGSYEVQVKNDNDATDNTSNELVVTQTPINPTLTCPTGVTESTTPTSFSGILGTSSSLNIAVMLNSALKASGSASISGTGTSATWSYSSTPTLTAGNYTATATGNTGLTASCSFTVTQNLVSPTISAATTTDLVAPTLSGTAGTSSSLTVSVTGQSGFSCPVTINADKTWSCRASAALPAGSYTTTVTGAVGTTPATSILTVSPSAVPTVIPTTTTNNVAPVLSGTLGAATSLTITVKNSATQAVVVPVTTVTLTAAQLTAKTWTFTPSTVISGVGTYDVIVVGQTASMTNVAPHGELTVTASVVPTVTPTSSTDKVKPTLSGNVGSSTTLAVVIKSSPQVTGNATITGSTWTFQSPSFISAGTYDVAVTGNSGLTNAAPHGELTITTCSLPQIYNVTGTLCINQVSPTVNTATATESTAAQLSGTTGTSTSLVIKINDATGATKATGNATLNAAAGTWTYSAPLLTGGIYDVVATGDTGMQDSTVDELKITVTCTLPKIPNNTNTACVAPTPTVTAKTITITQQPTTISGTVGTVVLTNNEAFSVTVNNISYTPIVTGLNWQLQLPTLNAGSYEVDAIRNAVHDVTTKELTITDKISICNNNKDEQIERADWQAWKEGTDYYLGQCNVPQCGTAAASAAGAKTCSKALPDPKDLPPKPDATVNATVKVNGLIYCSDGGVMSDSDMDATIKRASIENATTENGTIDSANLVGARIKYGVKTQGVLDISNATRVTTEQWTGVTLTDVAIDQVFVDAAVDYVDPVTGIVDNSSNSYIRVTGGITKPTTTKENGTITNASVISGVIVSGQTKDGNPVRGSITSGSYTADITNASSVLTKGRRVKGALLHATITGARITTMNGTTVIDDGTIQSAEMDIETEIPSAFGTVVGAKLDNVSISNSNHCFMSGSVGSKGQLNWKEVVKE